MSSKLLLLSSLSPFFVFANVGSAMTADKLSGSPLAGLYFMALAHTLVVAVMISAGFRISGGHLNPAVTLGICVGGHITIARSIPYWIDQCLASAAAFSPEDLQLHHTHLQVGQATREA
ncbi:unnamed protein product [Coffea canephora]|uniref:Aquaporin n=1 Tax=Coffea canephora TaxID=49390 RepID=A0A068V514_COFCA|nr:unnamed protein product [Coffea canephora]